MAVLRPAPGSTILFEGDSLTAFRVGPCLDTWAWQRLTGAHYGYPEKVGDWIFCHRPDLALTCRTGAVGGSTMADVLARFPLVTAGVRPAKVVMTIGGNDAARGVPLADFRRQVDEYCQRLHDLCAGRVLYLGPLAAAHGAAPDLAARRAVAQPHYRAAVEAVTAHDGLAVDLGAILVRRAADLARLWSGHTIYHDGGHFNQVGNEIVAGVVLQALGLMTMPGSPDHP